MKVNDVSSDASTTSGIVAPAAQPDTAFALPEAPERLVDDDGSCFSRDSWALDKCGLRKARRALRGFPDPGPIAVIDIGSSGFDHPCLTAAVTLKPASGGSLSTAVHAAEVTGVIVSACPARIRVYNVATARGLDMGLILDALRDARASKVRVINLSIGWHERETTLNTEIEQCISDGIVVVAAMGEYEEPNEIVSYPAAIPGVIAVGATDKHDRRFPGSAVGSHIWLAAPGEDISTVAPPDAFCTRQGTSFSAPLVSAAAWLALRANPKSSPDDIGALLAKSADATQIADPPNKTAAHVDEFGRKRNPAVGYGRLNVANLA